MKSIPIRLNLLDTCTSQYFQGFSGPTIAVPVDARTTAGDLQTALMSADEWPTDLLDGELWEPIRNVLNPEPMRLNPLIFPEVGPDNPPEGLWVSPMGSYGWVVIDQEDGAVGGPFPSEKYALCEAWDGRDEIETVYAYFGISLDEPDGYLIRQMNACDNEYEGRWEFVLTDESGEPLEGGESSDSFDTEMDAKVGAWRDYLSQKPDDVRLTADGYHALHDGLSDMIESGRLTEADIPDDYHWLVESLADLGGRNPEDPVRMAKTAAEQLVLAYAKARRGGHILWEDVDIAHGYAMSAVSAEFMAEVNEEYPEEEE